MELLPWVMTSGIWSCGSENWTVGLPHLQTLCLFGRQQVCQNAWHSLSFILTLISNQILLNNQIGFPSSSSSLLSFHLYSLSLNSMKIKASSFCSWLLNSSSLCPLSFFKDVQTIWIWLSVGPRPWLIVRIVAGRHWTQKEDKKLTEMRINGKNLWNLGTWAWRPVGVFSWSPCHFFSLKFPN